MVPSSRGVANFARYMKLALPPGSDSNEVAAYFVFFSHSKISDLISSAVFGAAIFYISCSCELVRNGVTGLDSW